MRNSYWLATTAAIVLCLFNCSDSSAEELLLEDYSDGGQYSPADWDNTFEDPEGNANASKVEKKVAVVEWAAKWSGLSSTGESADLSRFKSFQVDVMVEKTQPVEDETNFYFQLLNKVDTGYSYWEIWVPQSEVPADGKWHRITFPIAKMAGAAGEGADKPTDSKTIFGCVCGMTYDEAGDEFKFKKARFDNVTLLTGEVEATKVEDTPKQEE